MIDDDGRLQYYEIKQYLQDSMTCLQLLIFLHMREGHFRVRRLYPGTSYAKLTYFINRSGMGKPEVNGRRRVFYFSTKLPCILFI